MFFITLSCDVFMLVRGRGCMYVRECLSACVIVVPRDGLVVCMPCFFPNQPRGFTTQELQDMTCALRGNAAPVLNQFMSTLLNA